MRRSVTAAVSVTAAAALAAAAVAGTADAHSRFSGHFLPPPTVAAEARKFVISGTVFPRQGVNITVGQNLPYETGTDSEGNACSA